ncbi:hypothetical protein N6H14_18335 [Paenibacillus sp. CC-CFT747]|nr:hypothetical protein N6H14_18335 [Paenibacillus sp. CC-CFT747]
MKLSRIFPFNWLGDLFRFLRSTVRLGKENVQSSLRLQLIFTFVICLLASVLTYSLSDAILGEVNRAPSLTIPPTSITWTKKRATLPAI